MGRPPLSDEEFTAMLSDPSAADPEVVSRVRMLAAQVFRKVGGERFYPDDRLDEDLHLRDLAPFATEEFCATLEESLGLEEDEILGRVAAGQLSTFGDLILFLSSPSGQAKAGAPLTDQERQNPVWDRALDTLSPGTWFPSPLVEALLMTGSRSQALLGQHLLDRRGFLAHMATGMGGIALSALLAERGLLAAGPPALESRPLAPKPPHVSGQGEAGLAHLLHRGGQPSGHLGLQARADQAARPADARGREADHLPGRERRPEPEPLEIPAPRADGQARLRPAAPSGRAGR